MALTGELIRQLDLCLVLGELDGAPEHIWKCQTVREV